MTIKEAYNHTIIIGGEPPVEHKLEPRIDDQGELYFTLHKDGEELIARYREFLGKMYLILYRKGDQEPTQMIPCFTLYQ